LPISTLLKKRGWEKLKRIIASASSLCAFNDTSAILAVFSELLSIKKVDLNLDDYLN
jgi:hypothetical protein